MALPNTNISVAMVKAELGASTNDVGQLCIHPNINKWSKWKPVSYPEVGVLTEQQIKEVYHGIEIINATTPLGLYSQITQTGETYIYRKPSGNASSPYRLVDFRKYTHIGGDLPTTTGEDWKRVVYLGNAINYNQSVKMDISSGLTPIESDYLIFRGDVYPDGYDYRGVLLVNGTESVWMTGNEIEFNQEPLKSWRGEIWAMQFITDKPQTSLEVGNNRGNSDKFYAVTSDKLPIPVVVDEIENANPYKITISTGFGEGVGTDKYDLTVTAIFHEPINPTPGVIQGYVNSKATFSSLSPSTIGGWLENVKIEVRANNQIMTSKEYPTRMLVNNSTEVFSGDITPFTTPSRSLTVLVYEGGRLIKTQMVMINPIPQ